MARVQARQLRRFARLHWKKETTEGNNAALKRENARLRAAATQVQSYLGTFLGNVWRTIHEEPKEKWPQVFGKMYADHFQGAVLCVCGVLSPLSVSSRQEIAPSLRPLCRMLATAQAR
jgi:hypothetical protein